MADETKIGWCILELMGHRRLGGYAEPVEIAGAGMIRIDIPAPEMCAERVLNRECGVGPAKPPGPWQATQFYSPSAVYCFTPTTADVAISFARNCQPEPVSRWDLRAIPERSETVRSPAREDEDDDDPGF